MEKVTTVDEELKDMSPRELPKKHQYYKDYIHDSLTVSTWLKNLAPIVHTFVIRKWNFLKSVRMQCFIL